MWSPWCTTHVNDFTFEVNPEKKEQVDVVQSGDSCQTLQSMFDDLFGNAERETDMKAATTSFGRRNMECVARAMVALILRTPW